MLNDLCWDDDHTIAQWLDRRWLQARVPGSSPGGDTQTVNVFFRLFPFVPVPQTSEYDEHFHTEHVHFKTAVSLHMIVFTSG